MRHLVDYFFFFSSRRRHTRSLCDWSSDVCSSDLVVPAATGQCAPIRAPGQGLHLLRMPQKPQAQAQAACLSQLRSEERRVGKECRSRWSRYHEKKKDKDEETQVRRTHMSSSETSE